MIKYDLLPKQLLHEGTCVEANFFSPKVPNTSHILRVHTKEYVENLFSLQLTAKEIRKTGFPHSKELVEREIIIADGTIKGAAYALEYGIAFNIAGGTHHAYSGHGEAFCLLNDQAIAARYLQDKGLARKILIIDLDVHQGNGTAEIFQKDDSVFTFSMHGESNYPFKKEVSNLDIPLPDNTGDEAYLEILIDVLPKLIEEQQPNFIFYLSGVDVLKQDKLGKLGMTIEGCKQRDKFVLETCKTLNIPVQCSMGGGYSPEIKDIIEAHANTYRLAQDIYF
ncbi:histone deacetylase [Neptunitalea chrysea]|uniref:Histone deacetylase n=2 Tax=Neptunitalea chrysea TaxID=1647581 RepID=A0A9W6B334_9FLAO|nr:histone deacetylase [Neptunitalea chrysea]